MNRQLLPWDYLIITASNDAQARAYESQLALRRRLGFLSQVRQVLVVADPEGKRVGSGGSTICCLMEVVNRELVSPTSKSAGHITTQASRTVSRPAGLETCATADLEVCATGPRVAGNSTESNLRAIESLLRRQRILIIHAGGDSRRLPAYGPCGKIFIPVPGESDTALGCTLFDRLAPAFLNLPPGREGFGQVVIAAGDALILFDPSNVSLAFPGLTALTCPATPEHASKHGVFCAGSNGQVRLYLQKPSPAEQRRHGAVNRYGQSLLDIGIMSFDSTMALALFRAFGIRPGPDGKLAWPPAARREVLSRGVDFYREICCAMGEEATAAHHRRQATGAGSNWNVAGLKQIFRALAGVPFHLQTVPQARFLHFGTTRQLITSGSELRQHDLGVAPPTTPLSLNNDLQPGRELARNSGARVSSPAAARKAPGREKVHGHPALGPSCFPPADVPATGEDTRAPEKVASSGGEILGANVWVEGCRLSAPLKLAGQNVVIGVEVDAPLALPAGACLDVLRGQDRAGKPAWFVRCYGVSDTFKDTVAQGGTFCGQPLLKWLAEVGAKPERIWDRSLPAEQRSLWNARVFPAEAKHAGYRRWLWMFAPAQATLEQKEAFLAADRYSAAEVAVLADQDDFFARRRRVRAEAVRPGLARLFRLGSEFSAAELAWLIEHTPNRAACVADLLREARVHAGNHAGGSGLEAFGFCRILHALGSALETIVKAQTPLGKALPGLEKTLPTADMAWLRSLKLEINESTPARDWARRAREAAFAQLHRTILHTAMDPVAPPRSALRRDETVWGRAPARLELGGGWTDTPPYTLEYGGEVANCAVNLNGQPPIHCYGRVIDEPVIRLFSIDTGLHVEVRELANLLDYRNPRDPFGLVKAALAIAGFSPEMAPAQRGKTLPRMLRDFGGGIELTTLAGIPKGSGLGTSSIIGATIVAVLHRMIGRPLTQRKLFNEVLRLEQALTTGGGWQDQIGGMVGGTKITVTQPGLFPDPRVHCVPSDVLDPKLNGGATLLYYTGLTRLAKNILQQVVGGYFNRDRSIMAALADEHRVARCQVDALARKNAAEFGYYLDVAWRLQQQLCRDVTNKPIESLLARIRPHIHGARILGAGSGGFMLMICKSPADAARIRQDLEARPLNACARFFDFDINYAGLEVTAC